MKKIISLILALCLICCSSLVPLAAGTNGAKITSPGDNEWIDPYKTTTVKWSTPSPGLNYKITIKNERTGYYIVQNEKVNGSSYSIKSNVLDFEEKYKIWVGTFDGSDFAGEDFISIKVNDRTHSQKIYEEATFLYPSHGQEISADEDLKITINGNSDLAYNLSVKDTTSGKSIVNESGLTKTSYTIESSLLTEGHSYKAWVGTYKKASAEKKQFGAGNAIDFKVKKATINEPPKRPTPSSNPDRPEIDISGGGDETDASGGNNRPERPTVPTGGTSTNSYEAAEIISPSDREWLDPTKRITIKWNNVSSDLDYRITVEDDTTGECIIDDEYASGSSYNIKANTLMAQQRYKVSLSTYADDDLIGCDSICINMNAVDYKEADFLSPRNNDTIDASKKLTFEFTGIDSDFCYRLSIVDANTNKNIIKNKLIKGNTYSLSANTLEKGKQYKLWIGTYINSNAPDAVGRGNIIYIDTADEDETESIDTATVESVFSSPEDGDTVNYKNDLTIKWKKSNIDTFYELTIKDETDNEYIIKNEIVSGTSYKLKSSKLKADHKYKAWLGTYNNKSDSKKLIGAGNIMYFSTSGSGSLSVKSLNVDLKDNDLVFEYKITGDDFGYANIVVTNSNGKTNYNKKVYETNGEIIIDSDQLEEGCTYTCEVQAYTSKGEKSASKTQIYTVAKSGFSVTGVTKPTGELPYKKGFAVRGVVGSAYPIAEAEIIIFVKGNKNDVRDMVRLTNYNQTAKNPNQFDIKDYDSQVNFGTLSPGEYTYKVSVTDTIGKSYTAVESNFSIVREKGTYDDVSSNHKNYEAIKQLTLDGILAGDGTGNFRPDDSITRAEFVKMLYFAFNLSPVSSRDLRSSFSDVDASHWAYAYIISAFYHNIISGKGNGKFAPSDNVTFEEAAIMLVSIKGWKDAAEQLGGWAGGGYVTIADKNGFFASTSVSNNNYKRKASRADVAQMFYNALNKTANSVSAASAIYTYNGHKLYAYVHYADFYVDASKALALFGGYDVKSSDSNLKGSLQIWDKNITNGGKSLKVDYDFSKNNKAYQMLDIKLTENGIPLANTEYKNYFQHNKISLAVKDDCVMIEVDDLAMLTNHKIENQEFVLDPNRDVTLSDGKLYSNDKVILNAQVIYDAIEELGGQRYLNDGISLYDECYDGAVDAYNIANDINDVYNTVGYLTTTTMTIGSLCVGNVAGFGTIAGETVGGITLDVASDMIEEICDTEDGFVCYMLANADVSSYDKFADYHNSLIRDEMTKEQAVEYITKYYEAQINNATILMAFKYFASKCPENFAQALLKSAEAAFGSIISNMTGNLFSLYGESSEIAFDVANFLYGTSTTLLKTLENCDNEVIATWANDVQNLSDDLSDALYEGNQRGSGRKF